MHLRPLRLVPALLLTAAMGQASPVGKAAGPTQQPPPRVTPTVETAPAVSAPAAGTQSRDRAIHARPIASAPTTTAAQGDAAAGRKWDVKAFEDWWLMIGALATAGFTCLLVLVASVQAWFFWSQLRLIRINTSDAAKAASAAETAANAAMAALPRPWILIEPTKHTFDRWSVGNGPLQIWFRIKNYGAGPAFINYLSASAFISEGIGGTVPDSLLPSVATARFPSAEELDFHITPQEYVIKTVVSFGTSGVNFTEEVTTPLHVESGDSLLAFVVVQAPISVAEHAPISRSLLPYLICLVDYSDVYDRSFHTRCASVGDNGTKLTPYGGAPFNYRS